MKYIILAIFILLAAPPLQASWLDMCHAQEASLTDHENMTHENMTHENMADEDCCEVDPSESCDSMPHCAPGSTVASEFTESSAPISFLSNSRQYAVIRGGPLYQFSSPPFRPPIS